MKRILCLVLFFSLLCALFCSAALAGDGGSCGVNVTWSYSLGVLTISGNGNMTSYSRVLETIPWYSFSGEIEQVRIESGVTGIGDHAFDGCSGVKSVTIADTVTYIGEYAFRNCSLLREISIPSSVESIWFGAFMGSGLQSVDIPYSVGLVDCWAFKDCSDLTEAVVMNPECSIGDEDHDVFLGAAGAFTIKGWLYSTAETYATEAGIPFAPLSMSGSCGSGVSYSFDAETGTLELSGEGVMDRYTTVTEVPWHAYRHLIRSVSIGNGIRNIGEPAFYQCTGLTSVFIPDSVVRIDSSAFMSCSNLVSVTIPSSVKKIATDAFENCTSLQSIAIPEAVTEISRFTFYGCTSLTEVAIPDTVTSIRHGAFRKCSSLDSIVLPESVAEIEGRAFGDCPSLTSVTIYNASAEINDTAFENFAPSLVIYGWEDSTAQAFADAAGITFAALIPEPTFFLPKGLETIETDAFRGIKAEAVLIPSSVTSIVGDPFEDSGVKYVYGTSGSTAEYFAWYNGYTFVPVIE